MRDIFQKSLLLIFLSVLLAGIIAVSSTAKHEPQKEILGEKSESYWFILHRKSNKEELFQGTPGNKKESNLMKTFSVKTGIPGERPTPLPQLVGKEYWIITEKHAEPDNPETAPYFITLNVPAPSDEPYGPVPYEECDGQCNWIIPGAFGLHGTANTPEKLSNENPGSSGCIRHADEDITYLFNVLDPEHEEIRYYVEDN